MRLNERLTRFSFGKMHNENMQVRSAQGWPRHPNYCTTVVRKIPAAVVKVLFTPTAQVDPHRTELS